MPLDWAAGHRLHRAADLAAVSGSAAVGPRKAPEPSGPAKAAAGCPEGRAFLVAEHKAASVGRAISDPTLVRVSNSLAATSPLRSGTSLKKLGEMSGERKAELAQADGPFKSMFCFMLNAETLCQPLQRITRLR
jgi:hypothetical protein